MTGNEQQTWNERYQSGEFGFREPDPFVMDAHRDYLLPLLQAGAEGLDLAGGAGHHAVWLAQQGWPMTLADFSQTALNLAQERAAANADAKMTLRCGAAGDLAQSWIQEQHQFGFVLVSFFLERALLPLLPNLLAPGGLLLYRTYTLENVKLGNPRGPHDPNHLLHSQELLTTYSALRILHYNETVVKKGDVELIAQRA
jgi:tellurite methyltransferase